MRTSWATIDAVGDQSEYVTVISTALYSSVPRIGGLISDNYFRFFCEKLVTCAPPLPSSPHRSRTSVLSHQGCGACGVGKRVCGSRGACGWGADARSAVVPRVYQSVLKCRRFSEAGAQQLLLDVVAMKQVGCDSSLGRRCTKLKPLLNLKDPAEIPIECQGPYWNPPEIPSEGSGLAERKSRSRETALFKTDLVDSWLLLPQKRIFSSLVFDTVPTPLHSSAVPGLRSRILFCSCCWRCPRSAACCRLRPAAS